MEKRKAWKLNIVLNYFVLAMALVVLGISIYDYTLTQQVDWFYVGLGVVMIFNSVFSVFNAKRKLHEEEK